jgi:hypothetical protein
MIVYFPDLDTLQLALASGIVPSEIALKSALAGFGDEGQIWVETSAKLSAAVQREMKRFGVVVCKSNDAALNVEVSCWLELLPLVPAAAPLDSLEKTPVLFDVPSGEELSRLVLEMLRLGNDRQSYRWLAETGTRTSPECRALLRAIGPPYYSLLRALDGIGGPEIAPHAYIERAPGVWVEVGQRHPLEANIKPAKGKIVLMRSPRNWLSLPDVPFRDIYDLVEFQLPGGVAAWQDSPLPHRLTVAPRLRQAGPADGAELWVLRGAALDELNRFVQNAEDRLLSRLTFAVGEKNGQTIVVLRVRQSKLPPPILVLPAEAYKSHLKLPNLFLPAGSILHPPLRRDVVRKLLAEDAGQITWLVPTASEGVEHPVGAFVAESLPDDVFRPLTDWVDYVLDRDREKLQAWVQAMQFDFEPFLCDEEEQNKPKKPPASEKSRRPKGASKQRTTETETDETTPFETLPKSAAENLDLETFAASEPSEIEKELHAVEQEFLSLPNGLEDESRRTYWPRLAQLNERLMRTEEAGMCWLHLLWDANAAEQWSASWFRTEALGVEQRHCNNSTLPQSWLAGALAPQGFRREIDGSDLDCLLASTEPTATNVRALAAYLVWVAQREPRPAMLAPRLPAIQRFLEKHEHVLPVRAVWLAWYHLVQMMDGDVLALARARDRLLERLFQYGLRPELDLPSFLRFAGQPSGQRFREVCAWMKQTCEKARKWVDDNGDFFDRKTPTKAYADLLFAFGLARLGENEDAKRLLQRARSALSKEDTVHRFLVRAFETRIQTVLDGKPHTGPLPQALRDELESMDRLHRYVVERVRHNSRILEPDRQLNPYRHWAARLSGLDEALTELVDLSERLEIQERLRALLRKTPKGAAGHEDRARIVRVGLELGPHLGEEFAREMLDLTLPVFNALPEPPDSAAIAERAKFLEKALFTAAHFGCTEHVRLFISRFREMLQAQRGPQAIDAVALLAEQSFRSLRKLGMRDQIDRLLGEMAVFILQGKDVDAMTRSFNAKKDAINPLIALLHVAGSWYYFGRDQSAEPVVRAARTILFGGELTQPSQRRDLACAYARTVGQAPAAIALPRLEELFGNLKSYRDSFTTSDHFSVVQMDLIEAVVLAIVTDDFMQVGEMRRWLDEDEYLVRQRIHADVRNWMA